MSRLWGLPLRVGTNSGSLAGGCSPIRTTPDKKVTLMRRLAVVLLCLTASAFAARLHWRLQRACLRVT